MSFTYRQRPSKCDRGIDGGDIGDYVDRLACGTGHSSATEAVNRVGVERSIFSSAPDTDVMKLALEDIRKVQFL